MTTSSVKMAWPQLMNIKWNATYTQFLSFSNSSLYLA